MQHLVFSLPANLQFGLLEHKGGQVTCQRSPSKWSIALGLNSGSTWFTNFYCLVWMLPIHQPCSSLPTPQPTHPPSLVTRLRAGFFTIHPAHTEFGGFSKTSICTATAFWVHKRRGTVPPQKPILWPTLPTQPSYRHTQDRKASVVLKQGLSQAGHSKKSLCSPNLQSLGSVKAPENSGEIHILLSLGSLGISWMPASQKWHLSKRLVTAQLWHASDCFLASQSHDWAHHRPRLNCFCNQQELLNH